MADRYTPADAAAKQLQDILAQGKSLESSGKDESLFNLLSAGFSTMMSLTKSQNKTMLNALPADRRDTPEIRVSQHT